MKTLLIAALALATPAFAQEAPQRGGTLDFGVVFEPPTSDCHAGNTFAVLHAVSPHYSTLLKLLFKPIVKRLIAPHTQPSVSTVAIPARKKGR